MKEGSDKVIDIEKAIRSGNNKLLRSLPGFMVRFIRNLAREDEINATINRSRHLEGLPFIKDILEGWNVEVIIRGGENIPASGRVIFACNHPVGGMDALAFFTAIHNYYPSLVSPANQLLNYIPNLRPLVLGLDVFGKASRDTVARLDRLYESDTPVMIFPAGEVSRRNKGVISDITWQKSFITKAVQHMRDIVPVHISGRNSNLFYNIASARKLLGIKMYIETILLPREMINQRNKPVIITFGESIPFRTFTEVKTQQEWAQYVKSVVYSLPLQKTNQP